MNIDYPIIYEIARNTYAVNEFGMVTFFILSGSERGLVIDCGCASFDTKSLIDTLCPTPYDVVLTHAHGKNCNAMGFFDQVWIHPLDQPLLSNMDLLFDHMYHNSAIWDGSVERHYTVPMPDGSTWTYPADQKGARDLYDFSQIYFREFDTTPDFLFLTDGQTFSLGQGRTVTVLHVPGHTAGHCMYLDSESRILFSGNGIQPNLNIQATDAETALGGLLHVKDFRPDFDRIFGSATASGADTAGFSLPVSVLDDCIGACRSLLHGAASDSDNSYIYYGSVRLQYNPDSFPDAEQMPVLKEEKII